MLKIVDGVVSINVSYMNFQKGVKLKIMELKVYQRVGDRGGWERLAFMLLFSLPQEISGFCTAN